MIPLQLPQIPSRHFCGRETELLAIRTSLNEQEAKANAQRVVVIHGLGGVGKTQLCLTYVLNNKSSYKAVFWINASSKRTICDHFRQIAQALVDWAAQIRAEARNFSRIAFDLGLGQTVSPTTGEVSAETVYSSLIIRAVKAWLERPDNHGWSLVFDAADDLEEVDLPSFFPVAATGDILITSRRPLATQLGEGIEVKCLQPSAGRDLLLSEAQLDAKEGSSSP